MADKGSALIVIGIIILLVVAVKFWPSASPAQPVQQPPPSNIVPGNPTPQCITTSTNLIVGPVEDYYSGAKLPFLSHKLYLFDKNNQQWTDLGTYTDGTVKILTPGDFVRVLYNFNGSSTTSYAAMANFTLPCNGGAATTSLDGGAYRLVNKTSVAFIQAVVRNVDGTINSATSQQTLGNKTRTMNFEVDFPQNSGFGINNGAGNGMQVICSWNSSSINRISLASGLQPASVLASRIKAPNNLLLTGWELPAVTSGGMLKDKLVVENTLTSGNSESINCTGVDYSWYIPNQGGNIPVLDAQDNLQNDVGGNDFSFIFNITS